jgi:hypothetical protein
MSPFFNTFFGGGEYGGGRQFFKFFSKYFDNYLFHLKTLQVSEGVLGTNFFVIGP